MFQTLTIKTLLLFCFGSIVFAAPAMYTTPDGNTYFAPNNNETRRFKLNGKKQVQGRIADVYPVVDVDTGKEFLLKRSKKEGDIGEHEIDFVRKHGFLESVLSENEFVMKILPGKTLNEYYKWGKFKKNFGSALWNSYVRTYYQAYLMTKELHERYGQMHYDLHTGNIMAESDVNGTIVAMRAIDFGHSVPLHDEIRRILPMLKKRHPNLTNEQCIEHAKKIALAYDFRYVNLLHDEILNKYYDKITVDPKIKGKFRKLMERMQSYIDEFGLWSPYEMLYVYKPKTYAELKMQYDMALNMVVDIQRKTGQTKFNFHEENIRVHMGRRNMLKGIVIGSMEPNDMSGSEPIEKWIQALKKCLKEQHVQKTDDELESTARRLLIAADFHELAEYFKSLLPKLVGKRDVLDSLDAEISRHQSSFEAFKDTIRIRKNKL